MALIIDKGTGYINLKNEIVIAPQYNFNLCGDFYNGIALVKNGDKKYGFINKNNEIVIPIIYDNALPFRHDKTIVLKDGLSFFIDQKGEIIKIVSKPFLWTESETMIRYAE